VRPLCCPNQSIADNYGRLGNADAHDHSCSAFPEQQIELHALHQQRAANGTLRQPMAGMPHSILNVPRRIFQAGLLAGKAETSQEGGSKTE
jgi:hypothetical protein